jgi:magnesium-transporting ATPase (P-type)
MNIQPKTAILGRRNRRGVSEMYLTDSGLSAIKHFITSGRCIIGRVKNLMDSVALHLSASATLLIFKKVKEIQIL